MTTEPRVPSTYSPSGPLAHDPDLRVCRPLQPPREWMAATRHTARGQHHDIKPLTREPHRKRRIHMSHEAPERRTVGCSAKDAARLHQVVLGGVADCAIQHLDRRATTARREALRRERDDGDAAICPGQISPLAKRGRTVCRRLEQNRDPGAESGRRRHCRGCRIGRHSHALSHLDRGPAQDDSRSLPTPFVTPIHRMRPDGGSGTLPRIGP